MASGASSADGRSKKRPGIEKQRETITAAAVELFARHGSRAVSVSQICEQAGVSRPTFYRCFKDKEALVFHLYQSSVREHVEQNLLDALRPDREAGAGTKKALELLLDSILERSKLAELVFIESSDPNSPAYEIVDQTFEQAAEAIESWFVEQGHPRPSRVLLKSIMAACQWITHDAIRKGMTDEARAEAKRAMWALVSSAFGAMTSGERVQTSGRPGG